VIPIIPFCLFSVVASRDTRPGAHQHTFFVVI